MRSWGWGPHDGILKNFISWDTNARELLSQRDALWTHSRWQLPTRQEKRFQNEFHLAGTLTLEFPTSGTLIKVPCCCFCYGNPHGPRQGILSPVSWGSSHYPMSLKAFTKCGMSCVDHPSCLKFFGPRMFWPLKELASESRSHVCSLVLPHCGDSM